MTVPKFASPTSSRRPLYIGLAVVAIALLLLATRRAAIMSSNGNWGGALGALIGPFVFYAVVQFVMTTVARILASRPQTRFATSRLNYVTMTLTVLSVLGTLSCSGSQR